mmetsp:Transcript_182/g.473  ORF Transcript_182/g.473 Transcript_182/m.473 type:complete len:125 (+) Transcript_182:1697-2071(+)
MRVMSLNTQVDALDIGPRFNQSTWTVHSLRDCLIIWRRADVALLGHIQCARWRGAKGQRADQCDAHSLFNKSYVGFAITISQEYAPFSGSPSAAQMSLIVVRLGQVEQASCSRPAKDRADQHQV